MSIECKTDTGRRGRWASNVRQTVGDGVERNEGKTNTGGRERNKSQALGVGWVGVSNDTWGWGHGMNARHGHWEEGWRGMKEGAV